MLNIDVAIKKLEQLVSRGSGAEIVSLDESDTRVIAEDMFAPLDLPPFDSSAMDGYAVRSVDCEQSNSTRLRCIGTSKAGVPYTGRVNQGEAVRIFTGAMVPRECDAVVLQEDVVRQEESIEFREPLFKGMNVRPRGNDIAKDELLRNAGSQVDPLLIAWFAACGISKIPVRPKVRVAIFSTGDELQDPDQTLKPGQIYDSNRRLLRHLLSKKPVDILDLGKLPDDADTIEAALSDAAPKANVVITTGGVSVGDADFVRPVVEKIGRLDFWNIALKPGKPLAVGSIGDTLFLGLPGNPVSTFVTYLLFVVPAIDRLSGCTGGTPYKLSAYLKNDVKHSVGRREYQRGVFSIENGEIVVQTIGDQGSNRLSSLSMANCLVVISEDVGSVCAGSRVEIALLPKTSNHIWRSNLSS